MSAITDRIQNASRRTFILAGIALGALYYYTNQSSLSVLDSQIRTHREELQKKQQDVEEAKKVAADKRKFEDDVNHVSDQLRAALEFLPTKLNEQDILSRITSEARSAGVNPVSIQPKKPQEKGFYEELLMDVELDGGYTQLVLFLSNISKIQRIVNIRGLELSLKSFQDEQPILKLKGTLVAYRYVEGK